MERDAKGHFIKGMTPWNKDTKGVMKANSGSFKKGCVPWHKGTKGLKKSNSTSFKEGHEITKGSFKIGYKMNQDTKKKTTEYRTGNPKFSGENCPFFGKKGELHHNWKGGITPLSKKLKGTPK
ncbi:hypothetical protein LCGC14_2174650, partial [marine sediment metagenome]